MNLSKREFLQVLGAGTVAGMGLGRWAHADAATASDADSGIASVVLQYAVTGTSTWKDLCTVAASPSNSNRGSVPDWSVEAATRASIWAGMSPMFSKGRARGRALEMV